MSEFEERACKVLEESCLKAFEAGKQSQDAEIGRLISENDELKHQKSLQELEINQISQSNQEWQRVNSELQKRVDNALQMLSDWDDQTYRDDAEQLIGELGDALRGNHE